MDLKIKISAFVKTASHSSPHSNHESKKSSQSSKDSPNRGVENQPTLRLNEGLCNKLQIDLGYLIRDTLNLDPQKNLEQNQHAIKPKEVQTDGVISNSSNVNSDNSNAQCEVAKDTYVQDKSGCCPCHCIIS